MQNFIRLFASFIPWSVLGWIMKNNIQMEYKIITWIFLSVIMIVINLRYLNAGDPVSTSNIFSFIFIFINHFTLKVNLLITHPATVCYCVMAASALLSVILKKPFTIHYAGVSIPQEKRNHPTFMKINNIITTMWLFIFAVNALVNYFFNYTFEVRLVSLGIIVIGIVTSIYIPNIMRRHYRKLSDKSFI